MWTPFPRVLPSSWSSTKPGQDQPRRAAARRAIATTLDERTARPFDWGSPPPVLWLDAGNGYNSGQILLGNALRPEQVRGAFDPSVGVCRALPAPSLQRPDLLEAPPLNNVQPPATCALAVAHAEQSATINQVMAALVASYVERLLNGTCTWMATYVDLHDGLLRCVPTDPGQVAAVVGLPTVSLLTGRRCSARNSRSRGAADGRRVFGGTEHGDVQGTAEGRV